MTMLYSENRFLLSAGVLDEKEIEFFKEISIGMDDVHAFMALHQMSLYLSRYYGKKVIILLDEYDTPHAGGLCEWLLGGAYGFYPELIQFYI